MALADISANFDYSNESQNVRTDYMHTRIYANTLASRTHRAGSQSTMNAFNASSRMT